VLYKCYVLTVAYWSGLSRECMGVVYVLCVNCGLLVWLVQGVSGCCICVMC